MTRAIFGPLDIERVVVEMAGAGSRQALSERLWTLGWPVEQLHGLNRSAACLTWACAWCLSPERTEDI